MMRRQLLATLLLSALVTAACGGGNASPTAPTPTPSPTPTPTTPTPTPTPTPSPTPTPTTVTLSGIVSAQGGARLSGATVRILDGANAGRSAATTGDGRYQFDGLTASNGNLAASASGYEEGRSGTFINGNTVNFTLRTLQPWSARGSGDDVFQMPTYITRVRITGGYSRCSSNFIVRITGRLVVNELLGTCWGQTNFSGVYLTSGGTVEITNSSGVSWSFTEVR